MLQKTSRDVGHVPAIHLTTNLLSAAMEMHSQCKGCPPTPVHSGSPTAFDQPLKQHPKGRASSFHLLRAKQRRGFSLRQRKTTHLSVHRPHVFY